LYGLFDGDHIFFTDIYCLGDEVAYMFVPVCGDGGDLDDFGGGLAVVVMIFV